ncbi:PAS domain S-box protein [Brevibacillus porteri]|uniref:PAS domain-containing sensor histidine kinase n=1 Tax=Brevibacillus porteri TaxID=2126350 RepID=UPI00370AEEB3
MGTQIQLYTSLFHNNPDAVFMFDMQGRFTGVNAAGEALVGYTSQELLHMQIWEILASTEGLDSKEQQQILSAGIRKNKHYQLLHKNGQVVDIIASSFPIFQNGEIISRYSIAKNITQQKKVEEALHQMQENFRLISENIMDLIFIVNVDGIITYASPSVQAVTGLTIDQVINQHFSILIHPEQVTNAKSDFAQMMKQKITLDAEYHYVHPNGRMLLFDVKGTPDICSNGHILSTVFVARDITERRQSEELLRYSDKLSVLGELAAGIAHEIRNPLTALKGFIQLMEGDEFANQQYLQIMRSEIDRITSITSELLIMAKPQALRFAPHGLLPLLSSVIKLLEPQALLKNVSILTDFPQVTSLILCEEYQIKQVFINIIKNGMEAMPLGGNLTIKVVERSSDVVIRISDQGQGIPAELLPRLGELFYSTKEAGTGLGLMVSSKIIRDHGGTINIASDVGKGTTVSIFIPKALKPTVSFND